MFYYVSKVLWLVCQPSSVILLAMAAGLLLARWERWRQTGRRLLIAAAVLMFTAGFLPLGSVALYPLEQRFSGVAAPAPGDPVAGIILLGGFEDGWESQGRSGLLGLNEAAERLTEGARLAKLHPEAKVVFTGGVGGLLGGGKDSAGPIGAWLRDMGVAENRIVLESKSRTTIENAAFTRELVSPQESDRWILVTSAYHMPRSIGVFRQAGFNVVPFPVDYRVNDTEDLVRLFDSASKGLKRTDLAFKEWVGLLAYWLSGRTSELFPQP